MNNNLFESNNKNTTTLAEKLRPDDFEYFVGQDDVVGDKSVLRKIIETDNLFSFILWGPAGVGKTTIANIIQKNSKHKFMKISAVLSSIKDVKKIMEEAKTTLDLYNKKTILFVDEIHRFNKAQQDAFLPFVEKGSIILIGATTENPSFSIITPLMSRIKIFVLHKLTDENISSIIDRAIEFISKEEKITIEITLQIKSIIINYSQGDARKCYGILELILNYAKSLLVDTLIITKELIEKLLQNNFTEYDKTGENHYDYISALHKSMRNSDVDAALYYTVRMLEAGEDPMYVIRRVVRFSSEDVGLADPNALSISISALQAIHLVGMPEASLSLLQAVAYNALAPKSNALYKAQHLIKDEIKKHSDLNIPLQLRNAITPFMSELGYGKNYQYAHDYEIPITAMQCLPDEIKEKQFYFPQDRGFEAQLKKRIERIKKIKENIKES